MESYITGTYIKSLREKNKMTQRELADKIMVSEKTISKWETGRGLPDISLIEPLAKALNVSIMELFNNQTINNQNKCANVLRTKFYVCPICGNVITALGEGVYSCCGIQLISEEAVISNDIMIQRTDELYISINSPMLKNDYISFICYVTNDNIQMKKLYPEQNAEAAFKICGHGYIYYYDIRQGLFQAKF